MGNMLNTLDDKFQPSYHDDLVGVESRIQEIERLLSYGSTDVYTLGIWGKDGIGKTTIARAIFNKISSNFDGSYFIENVSREAEKGKLTELRLEFLSTLLEDPTFKITYPNVNINSVRERLSAKKLLIVIDDVVNPQFLIESFDWFMPGSLIIVTTRDKQDLQSYNGMKTIYEMKELAGNDALKLFSQYAFRQNHPNVHYLEKAKRIISCIQGVPLVLKVLGSFLFERSIGLWESVACRLERIPPLTIKKILKISYDGLDKPEQNIFLDIARSFNGEDMDRVIKRLAQKGYFVENGIRVLVDKSLIIVSNNKIRMHNLLEEMGREIAQKKSIDDFKNRRLMEDHEETYGLLTDENVNADSTYNTFDLQKTFAIINFILELPSAVFDQLSSVHKPQYAIVSMSLSFVALLLCIVELTYSCGEEKITWKWRSTLPWLYYPSENYSVAFGNFKDIVGLVCTICQCIFATITFGFARQDIDSPIKISFWPIVFALGLLCCKFLEKPVRRRSQSIEGII